MTARCVAQVPGFTGDGHDYGAGEGVPRCCHDDSRIVIPELLLPSSCTLLRLGVGGDQKYMTAPTYGRKLKPCPMRENNSVYNGALTRICLMTNLGLRVEGQYHSM